MSIKNKNYKQETNMQNLMEESKKQKAAGKKRGRPRKSELQKEIENPPFMPFSTTGEIPKGYTPGLLKEGSMVTDKEALEKQQERQRRKEMYLKSKESVPFVQTHLEYNKVFGKLTQAQLHSLMLLVPYITYEEKPLKKEKNEPLTLTEIYNIWGVSRTTGKEYVDKFVEIGIAEEVNSDTSIREKYLIVKSNFLFKGEKEFKEFNTKIVQSVMKQVIESIEDQTNRYKSDKRIKKKMEIYPLSLLAVLVAHVHYQTFFLVSNPHEEFIKEGETVEDVLLSAKKKRRIKFLKKKTLWEEMTGQEDVKLSAPKKAKLDLYFKMLVKAGALGVWTSVTERMVINPHLMYVTPNTRNETWYKSITALFASAQLNIDEKDEE
ncbi:hypothetical protein PDN14_26870 [Bacillus cereus group sp. Bc222]|uniref:hypothetical protein n=1 Tax=Bacillus cereus group TaxID=86661 RepID=UPI001F5A99D9|nr:MULTISPECIES: hypothetical protein [Bacillus cereus group]MDA2241997.1 hypothetical protein [Bacillus cereus group sp. Bc222]MEB9505275.1 hypothetical protein [Bacillus anthracis]